MNPALASTQDQAARLRAMMHPRADPSPPATAQAASAAPSIAPSTPAVSLAPAPAGPAAPLLTIASGKGGVGKTSLAVNLSIALSQLGRRPTLLDADIGTANADVLCGLSPRRRLDTLLHSGQRAGEPGGSIAIDAPGGFTLVPGAVGLHQLERIAPEQRDRVLTALTELENRSDVFLIDAAAGVGQDVQTFVTASDATLLVVTPEPTSIADAYALIKSVWAQRASGKPSSPWYAIVNNAAHEAEARHAHERLAGCAQRFLGERVSLLGWVRHDPRVAQAVRVRRPFLLESKRCRASRDTRALARDVLNLCQRWGR